MPIPTSAQTACCLRGKYLFDIIDGEAEFGNYKLIILPDSVLPDETLAEKLRAYLAAGGKLLASGRVVHPRRRFPLRFWRKVRGDERILPTYLRPCSDKGFVNGITEYVMYGPAYNITATTGTVLAELAEPLLQPHAGAFLLASACA